MIFADFALTVYGLRIFPEDKALNPYRAYLCEANPLGQFFLSPVGIAITILCMCLFYRLAGEKDVMTKKFSVVLKLMVFLAIATKIYAIGNNILAILAIKSMGVR